MASSKQSIPSRYSEHSHSEERQSQFRDLYNVLSNQLTQSKAKELESTLENIHLGVENVLARIAEIIQQRDSDHEKQVQKYKTSLRNELEAVQESFSQVIQNTMENVQENLHNWRVTEQKKVNFEMLRKSLTHLRKSNLQLKQKD